MTVVEHLEDARETLENLLLIVRDPDLKAKLARAYADVSLALLKAGDHTEEP